LYLDKLEAKKNGGNFFDGMGMNTDDKELTTENNVVEDEDLSWLDQL